MVDKKGADHAGSFWSPEVADDEREGGGGQASAVLYSWREQEGNPFKLLDKLHLPGKKGTKASVLDFYNNRHLHKVTLVMGCV
ncbi:Solute carrier family 22 member 14 [Manis javanica]|nr:Solute carrier family 22 member 14 [Manis javanica]